MHGVRGWLVARWEFSLAVAISLGITGCSTTPAALQPSGQANRSAVSETRPAPIDEAVSSAQPASNRDEFFDPFAESDEPLGGEHDPWESFNSTMFEFNRKADRFVLKPVAQGYNFLVPDRVQIGVSNFFYNLRFVPRFLNNVFQGKVAGAGVETGRFLVNSTLGLGGFLDVATRMNLRTPEEDTGQTLGYYGVPPGPYLVLPLLPPLTLRDGVGYLVDIFLDPINWLVLPLIEIQGVPSVIAHKNRTTTSVIQLGRRVGEITNDRALNLETFQGVEEATLDLYAAVRNAYLQKRAKMIRE
ncbi:MAG: VacJ family lipoprotein [Nitrospira sp.]|nr:VacJ family lipoprotein [Nitrospira sp.]